MISAGSILWRCGVCNAQKPMGTGGICQRCRKFACDRHLETVLGNDGQRQKVCVSCLATDDNVKTGVLDKFRKLFS